MSAVSIESVLACPTLPSLPGVAMEVLELTRDTDVKLDTIAACVQNDQALTGKILRTINSSFYGLSQPCPTISRAIGYLGLNTVKSLVLGFSLVEAVGSQDEPAFDYPAYWRRSVYCATAGRVLADHIRSCDPEEAFIAGLLQDVGMVAMVAALKDEYARVIAASGPVHDLHADAERAEFGFDHTEVGGRLAEKWRLPEVLSSCIRSHHTPGRAPADHKTVVQIIALANYATEALGADDPKPALDELKQWGAKWCHLPSEDVGGLMERIAQGSSELSSLFKLDTGTRPDVNSILCEASDQMLQHQISVQHESDALTRELRTDGLTGVFNRRYLDDELVDVFARACLDGGCIAFALVDVDRFKGVNDTHGHHVGDAILIELARRLTEVTGESGTVFRYGGEEFVVLLPGLDRRAAAEKAETLRRVVAEEPFDLRTVEGQADALPITMSVGVAAVEPDTCQIFQTPEQLMRAADRGVYAAKDAGRNCVRVFVPRQGSSRAA